MDITFPKPQEPFSIRRYYKNELNYVQRSVLRDKLRKEIGSSTFSGCIHRDFLPAKYVPDFVKIIGCDINDLFGVKTPVNELELTN